MRKIFCLALCILSTSAMARSIITPNYVCEGMNGLTYSFYSSNINEIHVYNSAGNNLNSFDGIRFEIKSLETLPAQTFIIVKDTNDETLASFSHINGETVAKGGIDDYVNEYGDSYVGLTCEVRN